MSGSRSFGSFLDIHPEAYQADQPASALQKLVLSNNAQHLIDASVEYKVNWVMSTSTAELFGGASEVGGDTTQYEWVFPVTITDGKFLPSFDVRIGTRLTGTLTGGTVDYTIGPYSPTGFSVTHRNTLTISSSAAAWHDEVVNLEKPWSPYTNRVSYRANDGRRITAPITYCLGRLSIVTRVPVADIGLGLVNIIGVQLREYLYL
jgi:hypothetical protein